MAERITLDSEARGNASNDGLARQRGTQVYDGAVLAHETRKTIKRMRALASLLRDQLGEDELRRRRQALRVTASRLAGARDAEVRLATLETLSKRYPRRLAVNGIELLRGGLERERDEARRTIDYGALLDDLKSLRKELVGLQLAVHDLGSLGPGLEGLYGEARRRYRRTRRKKASNALAAHDWRKRVKSLYYALDALGGSDGARATTRRAERLGDMLGEEHDLWLLETYLEQHPDAAGTDSSARKTVLRLALRRRRRLHKRALRKGERLFKPRPGEFAKRMQKMLGR